MWTSREVPVILVLCLCKLSAKNLDSRETSEFLCEAQDKRGIPWQSEGEGKLWHSCDEIDIGNKDIGKYFIRILKYMHLYSTYV